MSVTWFSNSEMANGLPRFTQLMWVGAGLALRPAYIMTVCDICQVPALCLSLGRAVCTAFTRLTLPVSLWGPAYCFSPFHRNEVQRGSKNHFSEVPWRGLTALGSDLRRLTQWAILCHWALLLLFSGASEVPFLSASLSAGSPTITCDGLSKIG